MSDLDQTAGRARWPVELSEVAAELDALFRGNPYLKHMDVEVETWGLGWARTRMTPSTDVANITGTAHGGVVVGLADAAFEIACNSYGRRCVAVELTTHFLAPGRAGIPLVAEALEISRSARIASYSVDVSEGEGSSRPVATLLALAYRSEKWHLGADRYPEEWKARH
ncbi:MAG TPA: hotdog fold thioesterase [Actinomycetota bacterium]|nr:hotdog fold thioesterase [Actinomycetota bacterium]